MVAEADTSLAINSPAVGSVSMLIAILLLWPGLGRSGRLQHTSLCRGQMGSGFGTLCDRRKSESPAPERSDPPIGTPSIAWGRTWGNRARRGFAKFGRFAP